MAPRSAKTKKTADVKVTEQDAPKKGRGKGKNAAEILPENENVELLDDKNNIETVTVSKRGKKAVSDDKNNDILPPAKKGRKKKEIEPEEKEVSNDENSAEEFTGQPDESEQNDENVESNGHTEEPQTSAKGRKKPVKKDTSVPEKPEPKPRGRGRNAKQEIKDKEDVTNKDEEEEKPKSSGRGRGRKPAKPEPEPEEKSVDEEEKQEKPAPKNRKRGPNKANQEKVEEEEGELEEQDEDKPDETEPKKKESKARKGKKAAPKEVSEDEDEVIPSSKKRKITKKDEKAIDEDVPEAKPAKGKKGQKKAEASTDTKRKAGDEKGDTKKKAPPKNKSVTDYEILDFSNTSSNDAGKPWNFKISCWNVDGIRAWLSKGCLDYLKYEKPDILCLQEVKCSQDKLPSELTSVPGYHAYWLASDTDGYAGVGIYTANLAMNVSYGLQNKELDQEGRIITAEYEQFYLVCTYVPNSGRKLVTMPKRLQWNTEFRKYVKELDKKKPVIICGDMNVSHNEIDLANPKTNRKNAGFTDEEREGMTELLGEGFVDTFRHLYPDKKDAYTFWTYMSNARAKNVGWRLDYFIISQRLLPALCDNVIRDRVYGSDHCPLTLFLHLRSADKPKE